MGVRVCVPGGWSGQFGERVDTGAALAAFREALAVPDLRVVALHAHLGGEIASMERLHRFVGAVLAFTDELRKTFGLELEILDFGGSLACPTVAPRSERDLRLAGAFASDVPSRAPRSVLSIDDYVAHIVGSVGDHYRARGRPAPRIFLEPGRAMTANAQMLLCTVMQVRDPDPQGITWAVLDAGINVAESVRSEFHQLFAIGAPRAGARPRVYRLTGPTCTPGDVLFRAWHLPELVTGDALAIMDSGAYFVPYSTSFSYPQPGIAMVEDGQAWLLRRKETYEDLIARDVALQGDAAAGTGT
jgi:diaminopimelate decarboxylase